MTEQGIDQEKADIGREVKGVTLGGTARMLDKSTVPPKLPP